MKHFKTTQEITEGRCVGICPYCTGTMIEGHKQRMPTRDHIKPKSRFTDRVNRTIIVCSQCNFMKSNRTLSEFLYELHMRQRELAEAIHKNSERINNISYLLKIGLEQ
jgi:hypothetical protein